MTDAAHGTDDPRTRANLLAEALALWQGDAFAGLGDLDRITARVLAVLGSEKFAAEFASDADDADAGLP
ncbi:BTAD domain-containing putative transcriptional regulator [Saccharopolyspora elongata]|uniref:BTAD domain-containing putative transcriptional regulator n=1 Tax=Saccharopolyspora elongata TaxID=2530387 RepID=UPI001A9D2F69|nr:BTAD domain-containing putative transcriptional regulator [Saccharopolyspora elongata]